MALRGYHEVFTARMVGLADLRRHRDTFAGIAATGREVTLATMCLDRCREGRIAEHRSVADLAGLLHQIQA